MEVLAAVELIMLALLGQAVQGIHHQQLHLKETAVVMALLARVFLLVVGVAQLLVDKMDNQVVLVAMVEQEVAVVFLE
jgi:hypothetical protein